MASRFTQALAATALAGLALAAVAASTSEWASSVIGFSSQNNPSGAWAAMQALGAPDTAVYGDSGTAWAPRPLNGSLEYLTLGFATATHSSGATIRETYGNGFVYQIDALDSGNTLHTVWSGTDTSLPGAPADFSATWTATGFLTTGLKIYVNTNHDLGAREEIDAVRLSGDTTPATHAPEPAALVLLGLGLSSLIFRRRRAA